MNRGEQEALDILAEWEKRAKAKSRPVEQTMRPEHAKRSGQASGQAKRSEQTTISEQAKRSEQTTISEQAKILAKMKILRESAAGQLPQAEARSSVEQLKSEEAEVSSVLPFQIWSPSGIMMGIVMSEILGPPLAKRGKRFGQIRG